MLHNRLLGWSGGCPLLKQRVNRTFSNPAAHITTFRLNIARSNPSFHCALLHTHTGSAGHNGIEPLPIFRHNHVAPRAQQAAAWTGQFLTELLRIQRRCMAIVVVIVFVRDLKPNPIKRHTEDIDILAGT